MREIVQRAAVAVDAQRAAVSVESRAHSCGTFCKTSSPGRRALKIDQRNDDFGLQTSWQQCQTLDSDNYVSGSVKV